MMDLTEAGLIRLARHFYPTGYPITTDDYSQDLHPYQRTPEYARWREAWERAMIWPEWKTLKEEMHRSFDAIADSTQPWVAACRKCCVYLEHPLSKGEYHLTRVAAAVSVLCPLYVTYCTTSIVIDKHSRDLRLSFDFPDEARPYAAKLSALIERVLGYQAFPLQFANVPVPGIRVEHADSKPAVTLLDALFDSQLDSLF